MHHARRTQVRAKIFRLSQSKVPGNNWIQECAQCFLNLNGSTRSSFLDQYHTFQLSTLLSMLVILSLLLGCIQRFRYVHSLAPLCPLPPYSDDVHISCATETGSYATIPRLNVPTQLNIVEYNIDRNGMGGDGDNENGLAPIIKLLSNPLLVPSADVLILSEVARGCEIYGGYDLSGAQEIAKSLDLNFAYAVEYVVISQSNATSECTIGNALLSKYPIENVKQLRFESQCCRYDDRYGGRIDLIGDITLTSKPGPQPPTTLVHVHAAHLESGQANAKMVLESIVVRERQAAEMTNITWTDKVPIIIAGDLNSPGPNIDPTILRLELDGFTNSMANFTVPNRPLIQYDYLFSSPATLTDAGYCRKPGCEGISDHVPFWATYTLLSS